MPYSTIDNSHYLSRSWKMMTRDKGWYKPILVLAVSLLVPIVGPLAILGYQLEWARLTAWNVDSAPKQTNVDVGGCIKTGWFAFLVALVWGLALGVAESLVSWIFSFNSSVQSFVSFLVFLCSIVLGIVIMIAEVRATVYQKITPGFQINRIWEMVTHDFGGVMRVLGIRILGALVSCGAMVVSSIILVVSYLPAIINAASIASNYSGGLNSYGSYGYGYPYTYGYGTGTGSMSSSAVNQIVTELLRPLQSPAFVIALILVIYLLLVIGVTFGLLTYNSVGLWMRQFDVVSWGKSADPLPPTLSTAAGGAAPQNPVESPSQVPTPPEPSAHDSWQAPVEPRPSEPIEPAVPEPPVAPPEQEPETVAQQEAQPDSETPVEVEVPSDASDDAGSSDAQGE